jgi:predicted TPR repeat methyltransferase
MASPSTVLRLIGPPEADGEYVALRTASSGEEIVHLHDYDRLYAVPGLYEHVVQERLGCRSPQVAADGLTEALARLDLDPGAVVLLDVGAGTGIVGELARGLGISMIVGFDALSSARAACLRDRPGIYHEYLVGDLAAPGSDLVARLCELRPTALVSAGAFGGTHAPPAALVGALAHLPPGAPVVFTIDERWMQTGGSGGFGGAVEELRAGGRLRLLDRRTFRHRRTTTGEPIDYELIVAAKGSGGASPRPGRPARGPAGC